MLHTQITRRVFIGATAYVVTAPLLASVLDVSNGLRKVTENGQFFSAQEMTALVDIAEIMIPETDTPGATSAHVIPVLDAMMLTWAVEKTRTQFRTIIKQVESVAKDTFSASYTSLSKGDRLSLISALDERAFANKATALSENYRKLKKLVFHLYYTSEEANPNFMLVPGAYRGCVTQADIDRFNAQRRVDYL
ncbi:gluconate 2-dehydrogenase subunit 3 family protein [Alteromonas sp. KUL49]|uniref:gluconate 2-dehydrogenase subunit 3 family protein n=1 Tax=Alteromonas sp. KUL49 TaxID=2480798 RepID=UPI00102F00FC|nr:gluconate 2-dehydrogenase subunit 3 family protein [Alteromonas sp. KUL49]TAP42272.1 gluconate 2-dehydrogenase subunit 3 family protein [Alteromonas sp. KUL49]GEA09871.1 hypothetical protein KUL49_02460 [Alteromonas sp. KUL49]